MGASISTASINSCSQFLSDLDFKLNNTKKHAEKFKVSKDLISKNSIVITDVNKSKIDATIEQKIESSIAFNFMSTFNEIINTNDAVSQYADTLADTVGEVLSDNLSFLDNFGQIKGSSTSISSLSEYDFEIENSTVLTTISETLIDYSSKVYGINEALISRISESDIKLTATQEIAQDLLTEFSEKVSEELTKTLGVDVVSKISSSTNGSVKNSSITWIIVAIVAVVIVIVVVIIAPILKDLAKRKAEEKAANKAVDKVSDVSVEKQNDSMGNEVAQNN